MIVFITFSVILRLSHDKQIVTSGGNQSTQRKSPPNPKSLGMCSMGILSEKHKLDDVEI